MKLNDKKSEMVFYYSEKAADLLYTEIGNEVMQCVKNSYSDVLKNSISDTNATVTVNSKAVTIVFKSPVSTFKITKLTAQTRLDSLVVYPAPPAATGAITGAQVSIGDDISIDFFAEIENLGENEPQMQFTLGDDDAVIVTDYYIDGDKYVFNFATDVENRKGIAPQRMSDIIKAELIVDGEVKDVIYDTMGIRTVRLDRTESLLEENPRFQFYINDVPVMCKGSNWVPMDAYHSRDKDRYAKALELVSDCGCNILRIWGGGVYEQREFYDYCDRNGIMIWHDFMMACYPPAMDDDFMLKLEKEFVWAVKKSCFDYRMGR